MRIDTMCVELTAKCPLKCVHCSANAGPGRTQILDLKTFDSILRSVDQLHEIYLSGGEPFEHPDLIEAIRLAREKSDKVILYSSGNTFRNGIVSPISREQVQSLINEGVHRVDLSVYSMVRERHEEVTKVHGSFDSTIGSIQNLRSLGLPFGIHFVPVSSLPSEDLASIAEFAFQSGSARIHVLAPSPQGRALKNFSNFKPSDEFLSTLRSLRNLAISELVISSSLRESLGEFRPTDRDNWETLFVDCRGRPFPSEGQRAPSFGLSNFFRENSAEVHA